MKYYNIEDKLCFLKGVYIYNPPPLIFLRNTTYPQYCNISLKCLRTSVKNLC